MEKSGFSTDTSEYRQKIDLSDSSRENQTTRASLPPIQLSDKKFWVYLKNAESEEMQDIVCFAERWARLMQQKITDGNGSVSLRDCWEEAWQEASDDFTTMRMMARASSFLSRAWEFGDELSVLVREFQAKQRDFRPDSLDYPY